MFVCWFDIRLLPISFWYESRWKGMDPKVDVLMLMEKQSAVFTWLVCMSDYSLIQIGIENLIFGTACSYGHKVSSNIVTKCIYVLRCQDTQMCSEWHVVFWSVWADSQSEWLSSGASAGFEKHSATDPCCGGWTLDSSSASNLFICHPTMHWEIGDRRGEVGLFRRTTAGILQPNGHVFTLGCFLISHCNESNIKKNRLCSSGASLQQTIKLCLYNNFSKYLLDVFAVEQWILTDKILLSIKWWIIRCRPWQG